MRLKTEFKSANSTISSKMNIPEISKKTKQRKEEFEYIIDGNEKVRTKYFSTQYLMNSF